jgi:uncharacterized hydrophobic protein (TIGR00271 family)
MLQLRVFGDSSVLAQRAAERLVTLQGVRHISVATGVKEGSALLTADVQGADADAALEAMRSLGIPAEDVALLRLDTIGPAQAGAEHVALIGADLLGQARVNARSAARYLVFMAVAGVIAGFGVIDENQVLIVGAMAVSPDLLPVTAVCTGLVLRRGRLAGRGFASLILGLTVACILAAGVTALLDLLGELPEGFKPHELGLASLQHVEAETILVAFAAGIAGMLAVETRASAGVGVGISVTTIPAAAFLGVAAGIGEVTKSLSALAVLGANIGMMLLGGTIALAVQRTLVGKG